MKAYLTFTTLLASLSFDDSFIQAISIAPPQVHYYSEALPTEHGTQTKRHTAGGTNGPPRPTNDDRPYIRLI